MCVCTLRFMGLYIYGLRLNAISIIYNRTPVANTMRGALYASKEMHIYKPTTHLKKFQTPSLLNRKLWSRYEYLIHSSWYFLKRKLLCNIRYELQRQPRHLLTSSRLCHIQLFVLFKKGGVIQYLRKSVKDRQARADFWLILPRN